MVALLFFKYADLLCLMPDRTLSSVIVAWEIQVTCSSYLPQHCIALTEYIRCIASFTSSVENNDPTLADQITQPFPT